jgi:predicted nucleotidyltransferase
LHLGNWHVNRDNTKLSQKYGISVDISNVALPMDNALLIGAKSSREVLSYEIQNQILCQLTQKYFTYLKIYSFKKFNWIRHDLSPLL